MKLGRLLGKYASEKGNLQNSHVLVSLALSLVAILTIAIASSIPNDLTLNDYFQPLKSVQASSTSQNNTNANVVDIGAQNSASRSYSNPVFWN